MDHRGIRSEVNIFKKNPERLQARERPALYSHGRAGNLSVTILQEASMPLVDIQLIKGVFNDAQKRTMIDKVTEAMVGIEGEAMRGVTWVRVLEVSSGEWAIGGKPLTTADVKALQAQGH